MNKIKVLFFVFIVVSVLDIIGIIFRIPILIQVFKPFILLSLLVLYAVSVLKLNKLYVLALTFSFFGDVFLMFSGKLYFIIGLVSFLIAHLLFIKIVINQIQKHSISKVIISIIPFLVLFLGLILFLKNSLGNLLIPVIIYGLTICTFGTVSFINYLSTKSRKSLLMLIGAIVFISSDSVLAINKFYNSSHLFEVIIMITYILAQYLIFRSMVYRTKNY
ncbi:lysoplasmalogenase [Lutibacter sp.]|uniref:lysoplasmalogenase n=1 Tax=Lutibacter sp. TaxID=1925666 RepID=UPI0025BFEA19|nr:lysoplasmalogenase [Lutibacter sp.]MCF6167758.1 lysoplasmalogenase [Lutibacter sp.]